MFRSRMMSLIAVAAVLALAACSDLTAPQDPGFCPIGGGPGTCVGAVQK